MTSVDQCPSCKSCLTGERIPQEYIDAGYYGSSSTHYYRGISIVENDHHICWQCPDCGHQWGRRG